MKPLYPIIVSDSLGLQKSGFEGSGYVTLLIVYLADSMTISRSDQRGSSME